MAIVTGAIDRLADRSTRCLGPPDLVSTNRVRHLRPFAGSNGSIFPDDIADPFGLGHVA
jgi:hypothetical protein